MRLCFTLGTGGGVGVGITSMSSSTLMGVGSALTGVDTGLDGKSFAVWVIVGFAPESHTGLNELSAVGVVGWAPL